MPIIVLEYFIIRCNNCDDNAGPPQSTIEDALADAIGEGFENYGPGDGTGKSAVWYCPECAALDNAGPGEAMGE